MVNVPIADKKRAKKRQKQKPKKTQKKTTKMRHDAKK